MIIILLLVLMSRILPLFLHDTTCELPTDYMNDYVEFCGALQKIESEYNVNARGYSPFSPRRPIERFSFDPNQVDSITFIRLGLAPFQVKNIMKYRRKGGIFKSKADVAKIYGLNEKLFQELLPYIEISSQEKPNFSTNSDVFVPNIEMKYENPQQEKYPIGTIIELNLADTTELKKIPGIGSAFSRRIVEYRKRLGGFYSVVQLNEVWGITPEIYQDLHSWFKIDAKKITKITVNALDINQLKTHPYINYYQAKAFVELRKKNGSLHSLSQVALLDEFSEKDLERLAYYVDF